MTNKHFKKEDNISYEIKQIDNTKVDEIILEAEKENAVVNSEKARENSIGLFERFRQNAGMFVILVLLILSLIQSVELFNLKKEIQKGQFVGGSSSAPAAPQELPSQQGGC